MTIDHDILLIDADASTANPLRAQLNAHGFGVTQASNGLEGAHRIETGQWRAVVLDPELPGVHGLTLIGQLRAKDPLTPVLILSANTDPAYRVLGLEQGADDHVTKPTSVQELVARLKALERRGEAFRQAGTARVRTGGLSLDLLTREVRVDGAPVSLTAREFDLLRFMVRHPGRVFSRVDLLDQVWGYRHRGYEHTVNTHINRLRNKLERNPAQPERIVTVWGVGYKYAAPVEPAGTRM